MLWVGGLVGFGQGYEVWGGGGELLLQTVGDSLQFIPLRPEFKPQTASMEKNRVYRVPSNVNRKFN